MAAFGATPAAAAAPVTDALLPTSVPGGVPETGASSCRPSAPPPPARRPPSEPERPWSERASRASAPSRPHPRPVCCTRSS
uniref:Putative secreted protein n=1 Tax=Anopheles darlingi TaxID=43151 RepID=A0A2M4D724_ANODA